MIPTNTFQYAEAYYNRGSTHIALGRHAEASSDFVKAKELGYELESSQMVVGGTGSQTSDRSPENA
jgi:hypothetical protein